MLFIRTLSVQLLGIFPLYNPKRRNEYKKIASPRFTPVFHSFYANLLDLEPISVDRTYTVCVESVNHYMETSYYFLSCLFLYLITKHFLRKFQKLPPSPYLSLPILGHLYLLKKPMHRTLAKLSNQYGPVIFLQFGSRPVLVVSSPSAAEECFTKHDITFASRPKLLAGKHLGVNYTSMTWAPYGDHWRNLRKIAALEIFSTVRIQLFGSIRSEEIHSLINRLSRGSLDGEIQVVEMKTTFFELTLNIIMRMIAGKRYYGDSVEDVEETRKFKEIVTESFRLSGSTNIGDFLPVLNWFGPSSIEKELKRVKEARDQSMQKLIEEQGELRRNSYSEGRSKTMLDALLSRQESEPEYYTDEMIRGLMQVMISAGTDTSTGTMEWALSLLLNNPEALKRARDEIDRQTGHSRLIEDSDLSDLPYLHGILNETLRMCPAAALIPPHESSEECTIGGFHIPRGTMLLVNLWAIHNDPNLWEEPTVFKPERFLNLVGQRDGFKFMPFGSGRRRCPGEGLAMQVITLTLGLLIQCFEWERVSEEMVDMSEGPGLTMSKAQPLLAKCRPRPALADLLSHK